MRCVLFFVAVLTGSAQSADPPDADTRRAGALRGLRDPDAKARERAVFQLRRLGPKVEDLPELFRLLDDPECESEIVEEITWAFARMGPLAGAPAAERLLSRPYSPESAEAALAAIGPAAVGPIRKRLREDAGKEDAAAEVAWLAQVLVRIGPPAALEAAPELRKLQRFDELLMLGADDSDGKIAEWLISPEGPLSEQYVAFAFARLPRVSRELVIAAMSKAMRRPPEPTPVFSELFPVHRNAARLMARMGPAALPELRKLLDARQPVHARLSAVWALTILGPAAAPALDDLIIATRSRDELVWERLLPIGQGVVERTQHPLRRDAILAIASLGRRGAEAVPELIDRLDDSIRDTVVQALECLGPAAIDALPRLRKLTLEAPAPGGRSYGLQAAAARLIWKLTGDPEPLLRTLPECDDCSPFRSYDDDLPDALEEGLRRNPDALREAKPTREILEALTVVVRRLGGLPAGLQPYLKRALERDDPDVLRRAVGLAQAGGPDVVRRYADRLLAIAQRKETEGWFESGMVCSAAAALREIGDARLVALTMRRIEAGDEVGDAMHRLALMGPLARSSVPAIVKRLSDDAHRESASDALAILGAVAAPDVLDAIAKNGGKQPPSWGKADPLDEIEIRRSGRLEHAQWLLRQWLTARDESLRPAVNLLRGSLAATAEPLIPQLIEDLASPDAFRRALAIQLLGELGPKAAGAVGKVAVLLTDKDPDVRRETMGAVLRIGARIPDAAVHLVPMIRDPDLATREAALRAMSVAAPLTPGLTDAIFAWNTDPFGPGWASIPPEVPLTDRQIVMLAEQLDFEALKQRGAAARAALPTLLRQMENEVLDARATDLLVAIGGPDAVTFLIGLLDSPDTERRLAATTTLGRMGPAALAAVPALTTMLDDPQDWPTAVDALSRIKPAALEPALPRLALRWERGEPARLGNRPPPVLPGELDPDALDLGDIVIRMGPAGAPAVPVLMAMLRDRTHIHRWNDTNDRTPIGRWARALGAVGPAAKPAAGLLREMLDNTDPEPRLEAARALIRIGEDRPRALEALRDIADGRDLMPMMHSRGNFNEWEWRSGCRARAIDALVEAGDTDAIPVMVRALERHRPIPPYYREFEKQGLKKGEVDELLSAAAAKALGRFGPKAASAAAALKRHAADARSPIQEEARRALAAINKR